MKKTLTIIIVFSLVAFAIYQLINLNNKKRYFGKRLSTQLVNTVWHGDMIERLGAQPVHVRDRMGTDIKIIFAKNGSCTIEIYDEVREANWSFEKGRDSIYIKGDKIDTRAYLNVDPLNKILYQLELVEIDSEIMSFKSQAAKASYDN